MLAHLHSREIEIVSIEELHERLSMRNFSRRFACFTFDDGYRDNRDHALAVMREFDAPFTVFVASDFAEGKGRLWWIALERVIAQADTLEVTIGGTAVRLDTTTVANKNAAFERLHDWLRGLPEFELKREIEALCARHAVDQAAICSDLCMSWGELRQFAADPLVTIGAHSITHCNLAKQCEDAALFEMRESRSRIEQAIGRDIVHLAYPYGDRIAAGPREFALARTAGYRTAVTTRPGMIFPESSRHLTALPRVSLNGNYQSERILPVLTSGAATAMWNGFRRVDAA
jgi:peptidoglycan/xylan/chitin deacetylase (PgdA/CDA1 family)